MGEEELLKYMRREARCPSRTRLVHKPCVSMQQGWCLLAATFNFHPHWSGVMAWGL